MWCAAPRAWPQRCSGSGRCRSRWRRRGCRARCAPAAARFATVTPPVARRPAGGRAQAGVQSAGGCAAGSHCEAVFPGCCFLQLPSLSSLWQGALDVAPDGTGGGGGGGTRPPQSPSASLPAALLRRAGNCHPAPPCAPHTSGSAGAGRGLGNAWETCEAYLSLLTHETLPPHLGAGSTHIAVLRPALPSCNLVSSLQAPPRHDAVPLRPPNWAAHRWPPGRHRGAAPAPRPAAPTGPKGTMRVV